MKIIRNLIAVAALMLVASTQSTLGHGVQVGYTTLNNGFIRVYIEHWHGDIGTGQLGGRNAVNLTQTVGGSTTNFPNVIPDGRINNTTIGNLPGAAPVTSVSGCSGSGFGSANYHNDWVFYDFPPVSCTEALTVTINAGNSVLLTEACGNLYPATIQVGGNGSGLQVLIDTDTGEVQGGITVESCVPVEVNYNLGVTDACDDTDDPVILSVTPPSGSTFAIGTTTVDVLTEDFEGNQSIQSFDVTVISNDITPPTISCPADLDLECSPDNVAAIADWLASVSASDDCGDATITNNYSGLSDGCGATGSATVTFVATDESGNSSTCSATVTVVDTTGPVISSDVADILPNEVPVTYTVTAVDDCGSATVIITDVQCQAINGAGKLIDKSESCEYTVDGDTITITDGGGVGTFITITATATDECGNASVASDVVNVLRPANEGVGNGVDGNTPGHDNNGGNDDEGNEPGNPGAKGGKKNR
jgi:hypothetical protein